MSITTTASSTTIPKTTINAANDTCCNSIPKRFKNENVIPTEIGIAKDAIIATLNGNNIIITKITATTAIINSLKKSSTASFTVSGWLLIMVIFISEGSNFLDSAITLSTSLP